MESQQNVQNAFQAIFFLAMFAMQILLVTELQLVPAALDNTILPAENVNLAQLKILAPNVIHPVQVLVLNVLLGIMFQVGLALLALQNALPAHHLSYVRDVWMDIFW